MQLRPLADRVVLKPIEAEETTASGIVIPGKEKEKPQQAEILEVGPGVDVGGRGIKMEDQKGQKVIYSKYAGTEIELDNKEKVIIVRQSDILAVIE